MLDVVPQLCGSSGLRPLRAAIAEPTRYAIEPRVDGIRGLVVIAPDGTVTVRNRRGEVRGWLRQQPLARELRRLGRRLPILHDGTVLDGELVAERFAGTMSALMGSKRHGDALQFVVFDVPYLAGVDLRSWPWRERRERLELLARAFVPPIELSPVVQPSEALALDMVDGGWRGSSSRIATRPTVTARELAGGRSSRASGTSARRGGSSGLRLSGLQSREGVGPCRNVSWMT